MLDTTDPHEDPLRPRTRRRLLRLVLAERRKLLAGNGSLEAACDREDELVWFRVLEHDEGSRRELQEAARLIRGGRYGVCTRCGRHISASRLRAIPLAIRCLPCQSQHERTHVDIAAA